MMTEDLLKDNDELIRRLLQIPALKSFGKAELRALLRMSRIRRFGEGDLIFEEGVHGRRVYYLISGKVKIVKDRKELMVLQRTGDVFGEIGAIEGGARTASVVALGETLCVELDISELEAGAGDNLFLFRYMVFRGFSEILAYRLRVTTKELVALRNEVAELRQGKRSQTA
ncbi:MAG: cyclic nucleotide-binding domain-containing protein [Pseudomonadota bacterium]